MSSLVQTKSNHVVTQRYMKHKKDKNLKAVNELAPCSYPGESSQLSQMSNHVGNTCQPRKECIASCLVVPIKEALPHATHM